MTQKEKQLLLQDLCGELPTRVYHHNTKDSIDWLNANHFDYRRLIEKGSVNELTEQDLNMCLKMFLKMISFLLS